MVCPDGRKRGFESTSRSGHLTNFVGRVRQKEKKMPIYLYDYQANLVERLAIQ